MIICRLQQLIVMRNDRKRSEQNSESEDESTELFPRHAADNLKQALQLLGQNYSPKNHSFQLANCCFRCHHSKIVQAYNEFREKVHPNLSEPRISNLYENQQFVDLRKLGRGGKDNTLLIPDPCIHPVPKLLGAILDDTFEKFGYVPNLERFLLYYPAYLQKHRAVEKDLFESGKVESKSAYFVALCGAAEMGSVYMMARMLRQYLRSGGSTQWFTGANYPAKFRLLGRLNRLMARAPWEITPEVVDEILNNQHIQWIRNELACYVQIMAFAHQNAIIALSVGLLPEEESLLGEFSMNDILKLKKEYDEVVYESFEEKEKLAVMIPVLREFDEEEDEEKGDKEFEAKVVQLMSKKHLKKSMRKVEATDNYMKQINNELNKQQLYKQINRYVQPLLPPFQVIDKRRESKNTVQDYSDFNYKFMAYPILNSLTQDTADKIEALIAYSEIMTRGNFGSEKMNHTKEFRKAVRYYAQNLCGYTHHEYDFKSNVGAFLPMALKFYIRLVAMSPVHVSRQVVRATNHESGPIECFDLGHLAVLIANTKMSLELLLAVQAFEL